MRDETKGGVGGEALYFVVDAVYAFLRNDGQWQQLQGEIRVARMTTGNMTLPSLLGWDILQYFEVVANWPERTIWLR